MRKLILLLSVALGLALVSAPNALAATCGGWSCNGKLPQNYGCDKNPAPTTRETKTIEGYVTLEMRYSAKCGALWVRYTNHHNGHEGFNKIIGYNNGAFAAEHLVPNNPTAGATGWTPMLSVHLEVYGCHRWYHWHEGWLEQCTRAH